MIKTKQQINLINPIVNFPDSGVFYEGHIYNPYILMSSLMNSATHRIVVIDDIVDDTILKYLEPIKNDVKIILYTSSKNLIIRHDVALHNTYCNVVKLKFYQKSYDNYLIIDNVVFHVSSSFNLLGKKLFGISKMDAFNGNDLITCLDYE
ncbi:MAG: hypothetical protein J1E38_02735 [Paramuribaculum sp.]|nr:hypothetical protein [Paramuribaculum sp.]